jgi:hypothetical protein
VISLDIQHLRNQAKESIKEYVTERLPMEYSICLTALDEIIKRSYDVIKTCKDNREKLQALELFKETHLQKVDLMSDATTIDQALNYIKNKQQQQPQQDQEDQEQSQQEQESNTNTTTTTKEHKQEQKDSTVF